VSDISPISDYDAWKLASPYDDERDDDEDTTDEPSDREDY
jgi:hypothetical protein